MFCFLFLLSSLHFFYVYFILLCCYFYYFYFIYFLLCCTYSIAKENEDDGVFCGKKNHNIKIEVIGEYENYQESL
jgi:Ca2+/Na+ antiporter